jgi:hypothetical protein
MIKVSLVVPMYQSWEILRRQILYWNSLRIPKTIEIIIADDGSNPEPVLYDNPKFRFQLVYRANKQKGWTIPHILNFGAKHARGQYIMFLGIDHMISPEWISWAMNSEDEYSVFTRKCALLDYNGNLLRIQFKDNDCCVDYTSIGWVSKRTFNNVGGFDEEVNGVNKDVNFFRGVADKLGKTRKYYIKRSPTFVYMLPEKKSIVSDKGRVGEHWRWMSHLRPVHYLHRLPDRHSNYRKASETEYNGPDNIDDLFSFVDVNGSKIEKYKFTELIAWKHPAEVAWMLGDYR